MPSHHVTSVVSILYLNLLSSSTTFLSFSSFPQLTSTYIISSAISICLNSLKLKNFSMTSPSTKFSGAILAFSGAVPGVGVNALHVSHVTCSPCDER